MLPLKYGYNKSQDLNQQVFTWNNMHMNRFSNRNQALTIIFKNALGSNYPLQIIQKRVVSQGGTGIPKKT